MESFFVYILECADKSYYVGHTDNLEKRLSEHVVGKFDGYTTNKLPLKLVYQVTFHSRAQAIIVEQKIKGWRRAKKKALIDGNWPLLVALSNSKEKR